MDFSARRRHSWTNTKMKQSRAKNGARKKQNRINKGTGKCRKSTIGSNTRKHQRKHSWSKTCTRCFGKVDQLKLALCKRLANGGFPKFGVPFLRVLINPKLQHILIFWNLYWAPYCGWAFQIQFEVDPMLFLRIMLLMRAPLTNPTVFRNP